MKKNALHRGEYVSARVSGSCIEIFNRRNEIICIVPGVQNIHRSLSRMLVFSIDDGVYNQASDSVMIMFPSYHCMKGIGNQEDIYYSFRQARKNWPSFSQAYRGN